MDYDQIQERLQALFMVLQYDSEFDKFSVTERIQINQERGRLFALPDPTIELRPVPPELEARIQEILLTIHQNHWEPKPRLW